MGVSGSSPSKILKTEILNRFLVRNKCISLKKSRRKFKLKSSPNLRQVIFCLDELVRKTLNLCKQIGITIILLVLMAIYLGSMTENLSINAIITKSSIMACYWLETSVREDNLKNKFCHWIRSELLISADQNSKRNALNLTEPWIQTMGQFS